ncbi:MAG: Coenzyme F420 hydrogenase/dehydrogenase, beta subunit C-terminal domain [Anaerolineae bacterium]|nr:Coenzyme F420 hydrogenase/dehydrogenase, beta subunit C-terminal domain [Anaerolineae bacterium]
MPALTRWFEQLTRRRWTPQQLEQHMGAVKSAALAYAADPALRERSASGGAVTALLLHLLESGAVDGALVNEAYVESGVVKNRFVIAQDRESLLRAQGSKYMAVRFSAGAVPLLRGFQGRLAVVALPCDAALLRGLCAKDAALAQTVACLITLFCGHNSQPELTQQVLRRVLKESGTELTGFQYRSGRWRGEMSLQLADGSETKLPFGRFSTYQNLFFFSERKCLNCHDHFGYAGDLSAGDLWLSEMEQEAIKRTALLARTPTGSALLRDAAASGRLVSESISTEQVFQGQVRGARFHYNTSARHRAGLLLGIKIPDDVHARVRWSEWLAAFIALFNYRLSTAKYGRKLIFAVPKVIWKVYLYLFKALESL